MKPLSAWLSLALLLCVHCPAWTAGKSFQPNRRSAPRAVGASLRLKDLARPDPSFPPLPLLPRFSGEETRARWHKEASGEATPRLAKVSYLAPPARRQYGLFIRNGLLYAADGKRFDTTRSRWGRAIFVVDALGRILASTEFAVGEFHHSSLVAGQPVLAAGSMEVNAGVLGLLSDKSGHYLPSRRYTRRLTASLRSRGIDIDDLNTLFYAPPEDSTDSELQHIDLPFL